MIQIKAMKEENGSLYVDHQDYYVEENEKKVERTHFIKAMSDVGFKVMMSDPRIAEALINELFISIHIAPVNIASQGRLEVPLKGHGSYAAMDYHAITKNREHIIIEMQMIHHNNFDKRALFYAASTFANQEFEGVGEWAFQIKEVYAIQFVDYSTHSLSPVKCYEVINKFSLKVDQDGKLLPWESIDGIHLIQVELKGEGIETIKFPIQRALSNLEWWYYAIKYSDRFNTEEIKRCKSLGMSESIEKALEKLKYSGLNPQDQQEYEKEAELIDSYSKALEHAALEGKLEGKLEGLLNGYVDFNFQKISPMTIRQIKESNTLLPKDELMKIGSRYVEEGKITQEQLENFVRLVDQEGILVDPVLKTPIDE